MALKEQVSHIYSAGLRNVGSYQVSGTPWLTGSALSANKTIRFRFPFVPKSFTIINTGTNPFLVHFNSGSLTFTADGDTGKQNGPNATSQTWHTNKHYVTLAQNDTLTLNTKVKDVFLSEPTNAGACTFEMFAELTNISSERMYVLSGSGLSDGS